MTPRESGPHKCGYTADDTADDIAPCMTHRWPSTANRADGPSFSNCDVSLALLHTLTRHYDSVDDPVCMIQYRALYTVEYTY